MERTVFVKMVFIESIKFARNALLEQDSDYKQTIAFLVIKIKFNGIQSVFVKLTSTLLTVHVVDAQMEQFITNKNRFVIHYVQELIKFGMEKLVYVLKDSIL